MNVIKLTNELMGKCGEIKFAREYDDGNLLIGCSDETQMEKAKMLKMVGGKEVMMVVQVGEHRVQRPKMSKGVITGIAVEIEEEELKKSLVTPGIEVVSVKRMTKGPEKEKSESVLIEFKGEEIPGRVYVGCMSYYVREYIPKPMRCFKCQKFGHIAKFCKEKRRCARCSGDHEYGECEGKEKPKCCSCGGEHSVAFGGCPIMKKEVEIQKVKVLEKITYAQAVKKIKKGDGGEVVGVEGSRMQRKKVEEQVYSDKGDRVWVDKKSLVTFIMKAIQAATKFMSEDERIQVIAKAAIEHLGMEEIELDEIKDESSDKSSGMEKGESMNMD